MIKAGLFSSSSSLVPVPNILNLTAAEALSALSAAELLVGTTSTTTSGANSSNNGKIASQSVAAATLVERYSSINYVTYFYQAAPPPPPPPPATTWYCTTRSNAAGVSSYPSNQDETGSVCGSYATVCSTSGYPGAPSIPACPPPPPPAVTCSAGAVVGISRNTCPSGYAQQYNCTDGSSYLQCV